jgi:hypothetical protein
LTRYLKCAAAFVTNFYNVTKAALVIRKIPIARRAHMKNNPKELRETLLSLIHDLKNGPGEHIRKPGVDFVRNRKLPFEKMIISILGMEGSSLTNEILSQYGCSMNVASAAAFVQQRAKIKHTALESLFHTFAQRTTVDSLFKGYRLLAVDGSDIHIPTNKTDLDSLYQSKDGRKPYNLLHLHALYDIKRHTYEDAIVLKNHLSNENRALTDMVDRSMIKTPALIIADRGYESYNNMAHIQERGWKYLIRIKDHSAYTNGILHGFELPSAEEFDVDIDLKLTRKNTNEVKELLKDKNHYRFVSATQTFDYLPEKNKKSYPTILYRLPFRIVRFPITEDTYEVVVTNLDREIFPPQILKELYSMRWGIETSFRDLKYTIGLLHFHSKKVEFILQEIFARLVMYNFSELITLHVVIEKKDRKYEYKVNFSVAAHICREYFLGKMTPPNIEALISRYITPIRPGRSRPRNMIAKSIISFMYRVA